MSKLSDFIEDSGNVTTHIADSNKHREISDGGVGSIDLWSAEKIDFELSVLSGTLNNYIKNDNRIN